MSVLSGKISKQNSHSGVYSVRASEFERSKSSTPNSFRCVVELLDDNEFVVDLNKRSKGIDILEKVFEHLDLQEKDFFGLQFIGRSIEHMQWIDPDKPLRKQIKGHSPYVFYFRVRFFVSDPAKLAEDLTRYLFYLQIKRDILSGRLPCPPDLAVELASFSLQSEIGDFNPDLHADGSYVSEFRFIPNQDEAFESKCAEQHKLNIGQSASDAEFHYLNVSKRLDMYGMDLHKAKDEDGSLLQLGISAYGLTVFHNRRKISIFPWSRIIKISFRRKRFSIHIRPEWDEFNDNIIGFHMSDFRACKTLWKACVSHHTFFRIHYPRDIEKPQIFRMGSRYKYRGKTEHQILEEGRKHPRVEPMIKRSPSKRFSKRNASAPPSRATSMTFTNSGDSSTVDDRTRSLDYRSSSPPTSDSGLVRNHITGLSDLRVDGDTDTESQLRALIATEGILTVTLTPDDEGRFGFNVKGGRDADLPFIVSKISLGSPADKCTPHLQEGDEIITINGQYIASYTHEEVVNLIRTVSQGPRQHLVMTIRPNVFVSADLNLDSDVVSQLQDRKLEEQHAPLVVSLKQLRESLDSGDLLIYFLELYKKKPGLASDEGKKIENMPKNRYRDILPYDETRVKLYRGLCDYINANFVNMEIQSLGVLNRYIAAQGPLPTTSADFWQMVWEQESHVVVMLTTIVERGKVKCHQYFPESDDSVVTFGEFQVKCLKLRDVSQAYVYRELELSNDKTGETRSIVHLQYVKWPDHGVPDESTDFLNFVQCLRHHREGTVAPVVVHCSAGVGRTGVLFSIETAFCMIEGGESVYPLEIVRALRDQRGSMLQTPGQFRFVCEAILKAYDDKTVRPLSPHS